MIDPDAPPSDTLELGRPASGGGGRAHRVLQRLDHHAGGRGHHPARGQSLRGPSRGLSRHAPDRRPGGRADRRRQRYPAPAAGRRGSRRHPRDRRPAHSCPGDAPLGTRAGVLGRRAGDAEPRTDCWRSGSDGGASATWRRPAPASRPARSGPRCCSPPGAPTTGSRAFRSSSVPRSTSGPASARRSSSTCAASCARPAVTRGWPTSATRPRASSATTASGSRDRSTASSAPSRITRCRWRDRVGLVSPAAGLPRLLRSPRLRRRPLWAQATRSLRLEVSRRRDEERSVRATDPWSLFRNSDYAGGPIRRSTTGTTSRPAPRWTSTPGTSATCRAPAGSSAPASSIPAPDDVAPVALPELVRPPVPLGRRYEFYRLLLDFRRYTRITPYLRVNGRLRADGWVDGDRLPVQRRVSMGGTGHSPRVRLPHLRLRTTATSSDPAETALCDRVDQRAGGGPDPGRAQSRFSGRRPGERRKPLHRHRGSGPRAAERRRQGLARGHGPGQVPVNRIPSFDEWKVDVGLGLDAGEIGAYIAKGISEGESVKFLVRLQRRF